MDVRFRTYTAPLLSQGLVAWRTQKQMQM